MRLTLGISPCPNDTFMFEALIHQRIDTQGISFIPTLVDVEELNKQANQQTFDISKLSYHALAYLLETYQVLNSGSALGSGVGPLLIAKQPLSEEEIKRASIAIPGEFTTANFLLSMAFPEAVNKEIMVFSEIEEAVLSGEVDAGLIIHENRFTYQQKGLVKLMDLGNYWEKHSGSLIPLGGIAIRRTFDERLKKQIDQLLRKSIEYAFANREDVWPFVCQHAQEMDEIVIKKHIDLYVNQYSVDLGLEGRKAVQQLFQLAKEKKIITRITDPIFV